MNVYFSVSIGWKDVWCVLVGERTSECDHKWHPRCFWTEMIFWIDWWWLERQGRCGCRVIATLVLVSRMSLMDGSEWLDEFWAKRSTNLKMNASLDVEWECTVWLDGIDEPTERTSPSHFVYIRKQENTIHTYTVSTDSFQTHTQHPLSAHDSNSERTIWIGFVCGKWFTKDDWWIRDSESFLAICRP